MGGRVAALSGIPDKEEEARELCAERFIVSNEEGSIPEALQAWEGEAKTSSSPPPHPQS
jgi:hypothetical protein